MSAFAAPGVSPPLFRPPDLVERVRREALDVEPVEDHSRVRNPCPRRLLVARRQVRRHQRDPRAAVRTQAVEERVQRPGTATLAGRDSRCKRPVIHSRARLFLSPFSVHDKFLN